MAFAVERVPGEPIVILTLTPPMQDAVEEGRAGDAAVAQAAAEIEGRYFRIADVRTFQVSFTDMVRYFGEQKRGHPGSINDPRGIPIVVADQNLFTESADWTQQEQYGGRSTQMFKTLDEALAYARAQIEAGALGSS
ncbi:MAG: hypothetical protein GYB64_16165 [Chloroflexi bacterium]|nr:hypothetical protein [Chloroflexota bacterium]